MPFSSHVAPPEPHLPATVGRYEVVRLLGEGSMGRVLLAHDPVLDRDVAIKHLRGDLEIPRDARQGLLARMRHEARAAARVAHPNLVVLHDMGEDAAVGLYLVFEYVRGPTLKQRLAEQGRLPAGEAARLARELGAALHVAHQAGVLHRDVKPENLILATAGGKLADFGIARIPDSTLTHQGGLMGTPAYSAPETFRGRARGAGSAPSSGHSPFSDQFSLAATLYEAISGERAFPGDDAVSVAARIANDPAPPFAASLGLSPEVDHVLARALARRPEDRFPDCEAFGEALARALADPSHEPTAAPLDVPRSFAPPERRIGQVLIGAALVATTALLVARTAMRSAESSPAPPPAPPPASAEPIPTVSSPPHLGHVHASPHWPRSPRPRPEASSPHEPPLPASASAAPEASSTASADSDHAPPRAGEVARDAGAPAPRPSSSARSAPSAAPR